MPAAVPLALTVNVPLLVAVTAPGVPLAATRRAVDRTDYVIGPMTDRVAAEQQRIADRFHALRLIPKPIRIADAVWTPPARNG